MHVQGKKCRYYQLGGQHLSQLARLGAHRESALSCAFYLWLVPVEFEVLYDERETLYLLNLTLVFVQVRQSALTKNPQPLLWMEDYKKQQQIMCYFCTQQSSSLQAEGTEAQKTFKTGI